jgi:hypothetical protein
MGKNEEELGWQILRRIEQDHEWRKRHPDLFLDQIATELWRTMTVDDALEVFRIRLENAAWWAVDTVECLEYILRERPGWAAEKLARAADLWLEESVDDNPDLYLDWLAARTSEMRRAVDEARGKAE